MTFDTRAFLDPKKWSIGELHAAIVGESDIEVDPRDALDLLRTKLSADAFQETASRIILNKQQQRALRQAATLMLTTIPAGKATSTLIHASNIVEDRSLLRMIFITLGRIGTREALNVLAEYDTDDIVVNRTLQWTQKLLSYRHGAGMFRMEFDMPQETDFEEQEKFDIQFAREELLQECLSDLNGTALGLKLSENWGLQIEIKDKQHFLLFAEPFVSFDQLDNLFETQAVLGVLASQDEIVSMAYDVTHYLLAHPENNTVIMQLMLPNGTPKLIGTLSHEDGLGFQFTHPTDVSGARQFLIRGQVFRDGIEIEIAACGEITRTILLEPESTANLEDPTSTNPPPPDVK